MFRNDSTLLALSGGVAKKVRVQHPKVHECKDRENPYWFFRYWEDTVQPDGTTKSVRKRKIIAPSKGKNAKGRKEAEIERDKFLAELNTAPTKCEAAIQQSAPIEVGAIIFGNLANMWKTDFVERTIGGKALIASTTRAKYINALENHILPRWKDTRLAEFKSKEVLDWLQTTCESWFMMADLRNVMSGIITKAKEWEILPETYANPMQRVRLPNQWKVREERILDEDETARVLANLTDPQLLIVETCLGTGTRISEATGLQIRHVDLERGSIRIDQRFCRGDVGAPKTEKSKRLLALGTLVSRYKEWIAKLKNTGPNAWVFPQAENPKLPMWDTGVRQAVHNAAIAAECDFEGLGLHSFRRANITWRQEVGGSGIEAQKIAGHANPRTTADYTFVQLKRQDELTRRIQDKVTKAAKRAKAKKVVEMKPKETAA